MIILKKLYKNIKLKNRILNYYRKYLIKIKKIKIHKYSFIYFMWHKTLSVLNKKKIISTL